MRVILSISRKLQLYDLNRWVGLKNAGILISAIVDMYKHPQSCMVHIFILSTLYNYT